MSELSKILLSLEQRITNIENFINRFDFDCLPEVKINKCQHESDYAISQDTNPPVIHLHCIKCGEFYE